MSKLNYLILFLAALVFQLIFSFFSTIPIDLLTVALVFYAIDKESIPATLMGAFTGLVQDTLSGSIFGIRGFSKTLTAYLISKVGKKLVTENILILFLVIMGATYLDNTVASFLESVLTRAETDYFTFKGFIGALLNSVTGCAVFHIINVFQSRRQ